MLVILRMDLLELPVRAEQIYSLRQVETIEKELVMRVDRIERVEVKLEPVDWLAARIVLRRLTLPLKAVVLGCNSDQFQSWEPMTFKACPFLS